MWQLDKASNLIIQSTESNKANKSLSIYLLAGFGIHRNEEMIDAQILRSCHHPG